jgi:hypothetical protein
LHKVTLIIIIIVRDIVCFRNICINTLHKGDNDDDDDDDDDNNNNNYNNNNKRNGKCYNTQPLPAKERNQT